MSIFFLVSALSHHTPYISDDSSQKIFTIDRSGDIDMQTQQIENYLLSVTGQAVGLDIKEKGTISTLLPATTDYTIYRAYLHSLSGGLSSSHEDATVKYKVQTTSSGPHLFTLGVSIISFLLALFL